MPDLPFVLTASDRIEIHELPGRYGDAIDDRNWPALHAVFTEATTACARQSILAARTSFTLGLMLV